MAWCAFVLAGLVLAAPVASDEGGAAESAFKGEGRVVSVDVKNSRVTIDHEEIPGLMPAMRMRFTVERKADLRRLKAGDAVRFWLGTHGDEMVIVAIQRLTTS